MEVTFGGRLRTYRKMRGLTQSQLAIRSGVVVRSVVYWEKGTHLPGMEELESLASVLNLAREERQTLLSFLPTNRASKIVRGATTWADSAAPVAGDLIRALRWRQQLSRDRVAHALGVHHTTVMRWETGQSVPNEEARFRLCEALDVYPEERVALLTTPHVAPLLDRESPTLDACREEAARLARDSGREAHPLFDLYTHLLAGTLWPLLPHKPEARLLLAQTYAARAVYACVRGDDEGALDYSRRSLALIKAEDTLPKSTLYHALWASGHARAHRAPRSGAQQSLREAKEWLMRAQSSKPPAFLFMNTAVWALRSGSLQEAQEYGRAANAVAQRSREISVHVREGLVEFEANWFVATGRYEEGLEKYRQMSGVAYYHPLMNHLFQTSVFLKMGARNDADSSLRRAYALIAADKADFYRREADGYAVQLERRF